MKDIAASSHRAAQNKIRLLIADDHPLVCVALRKIFDEHPDFELVAEAGDGEEAIRLTTALLPDVVIMDISMPKISGIEATRQIKAQCPNVLVLILTVHGDREHIFGIFEAGADSYLTKTATSEQVIQAVRGLIAGDTVLSHDVFRQVLQNALRYPVKPLPRETFENITVREQEILLLSAQGMGNKEIAEHLNVSLSTVKNYFVEIFSKLNAGSRTEAVITALRAGIISIPEMDTNSV